MSEIDINHPHIVQLLCQKLNNQRKEGRNCDFQLKTDDGTSFPVHRNVLEATCEWFLVYFKYERSEKELLLEKTSANSLSKILNYLYIGETTVSPEITEIKSLLDIALYLGMSQLSEACTEILCQRIDQNNCCELLKYADTYLLHSGSKLREKCLKFILDNIHLNTKMNLSEISSDHMIDLLSIKRENKNNSEEYLYLTVQNWILYNIKEREQFISELFDKMHFKWLSYQFFKEKIFNKDNPLKSNLQFLEKLFNFQEIFMKNVIQSKEHKHIAVGKLLEKYSLPNLYGVFDRNIFKFGWSEECFTDKIADTDRRTNGYTVFGARNIFTCGGRMNNVDVKSCRYFSIYDDKWYDLSPMKKARFNHRVVTLHDKIYVCGGVTLNSMEIFDINTNCWQTANSLKKNMHNFGFCTFDDCIYAVDGSNFERFDPREGNWTSLVSPGQITLYAAVGFNNFIQCFNCIGAYTFDLRNNKWSEMITSHVKEFTIVPKACLIDNKIYVSSNVEKNKFSLEIYNASDLSRDKSLTLNWSKDSYIWSLFTIPNYYT